MVKKLVGKIHLWLGLSVGLIVVFLGITGCMLAFQREIESITHTYAYVEEEQKAYLEPSRLGRIAQAALPDKTLHSVTYGSRKNSAQVAFYLFEEYYYIVYINPYSGEVLKVKDMSRDFFRVLIDGHFYLWLPPHIGQPIVASATLIFLIMMITGLILWWPRSKAARKQRFRIKWNARWRRVNYDLHNVFGFYMTWVAIFIALTGLVFGFQWFAKAVYWTTSGGKQLTEFYEPVAQRANASASEKPAIDRIYQLMKAEYPKAETIEVHYPVNDSVAIGAGANPDAGTYWKIDYRWFDQQTLQEVDVKHLFGRFTTATTADKIARMNYDLHVGAIGGITTKIIAFFASLVAASLPITGFYIWWGRRRKRRTDNLEQGRKKEEAKTLQAI